MVMLAPPGAVERRYALALALRLLPPGAPLTVMAPKTKGGSRLRKELEAFGCAVAETARRHHRICVCERARRRRRARGGLADGGAALRRTDSASGRSPACSAGTGSIPAARC